MHKRFLVRKEVNEARIIEILNSIMLSINRTNHKVTYKTSKGIVEYVFLFLSKNKRRYNKFDVSNKLEKILIWHRKITEELEQMLRSKGIDMVEIIKDGPKTLELKKGM